MWVIAGLLLGLVVLAAIVGFHTGPHSHIAAGVLGAIAALWLAIMAIDGRSSALLWTLFGADLVLSAGVATAAWKSIGTERLAAEHNKRFGSVEGATGVSSTELAPDGIVRIRGEEWSATSANGNMPAGTPVQVLRAEGVRLVVWGEEILPEPVAPMETGETPVEKHHVG